jgi:hypothetical protein
MKNLKIKAVVFLGLILTTVSCGEDFLVETPKDALFSNTLFVDKEGMQQGLNAVYALARKERMGEGNDIENGHIWKVGTDEAWANFTISRPFDVYDININSSNATIRSVFEWLYDVVNASNTLINRAENDTKINWKGATAAESEQNKNLIIAQAKLLRAWAYRHLTNTWGDVPLNLIEVTGANFKTYWERTPVSEVRAQMEKDLLFAEQYLPNDYKNPLILSKAVAQHYLAELYLTTGDYTAAETKAKLVIANPNFKLITVRFGAKAASPGVPFMDQFNMENALPSSGNTETLWTFLNAQDFAGSAPITMRRGWVNRYYDASVTDGKPWVFEKYGGRGIGRASHTLYVEGLYTASDDRYSQYAFAKSYQKTETGTAVTLTRVPTFANWKNSDPLWPSTKKWDTYPIGGKVMVDAQYNNMVYLRLAETYLLLAEAQIRLNKNPEALITINTIRARSKAAPALLSQMSLDYVLDERARELFSEEHRRYVLNRMGVLVARTKLYNKFSLIADKNILLPLPQSFIDSNQGPTSQNPGY